MTFSTSIRLLCVSLLPPALMHPVHAENSAAIEIWPEGVPGLRANAGPEKTFEGGRVSNVNHPTLAEFSPPPGKANGTAVIVCPGGGYVRLSADHEGVVPAQWFASLGVTSFVLKYRLQEYGHPAPLRDILRAIRLVRSRAGEFGVRPDRIGVLGFSAGGHLTASAATLFDAPEGRTGAPLDAISARPDFVMLIYPVITLQTPYAHMGSRIALLGENPPPELVRHLSLELQVTKNTPPAFIVQGEEDRTVPVENSLMFYQALRKAGVPAELHLYAKGPHGFGMSPGHGAISDWPKLCETWLQANGWLQK
jgi:acetyl esterase/lipase